MPQLGISPSGHIYEVDAITPDSGKVGRLPRLVQEKSMVLGSPEQIARYVNQETLRKQAAARKKYQKSAIDMGRENAKRLFIEKMYQATMKRQSVPLMGTEKAIAEGVMKMSRARMVDFDRNQMIDVQSDFGADETSRWDAEYHGGYGPDQMMGVSKADFNWHRPVGSYVIGNPLRDDGAVGPVTDYDRFVNEPAEAAQVGSIPVGMNANGQPQFPNNPPAPVVIAPHPMGSLLSDITGINLDLSSQIEDQAPDILQSAENAGQQALTNLTQPKPSTPSIITKYLPLPTGTVTLPGIGAVNKSTLVLGALGLVAVSGAVFLMKRRS